MSTMGSRITDELKRLGYNSSQFSKLVSVTERSQYNYENDIRKPKTEYWEEAAKIGMNVLYVITGESSAPSSALVNKRTGLPPNGDELMDTLELIRLEIYKAQQLRRAELDHKEG